ncbi:hypothetical protein Tco_0704042 [Tanacetum coccineum]|uniref:Reverse transcriptase domain-containing protein n=1 Tax=Tanacetum coccineum TaxID=301880 RepID=A0ABQ4Y100_9ASTR
MGNNNTSGSGTLPSNTIPNPRNECKGITTRSGVVLDGPLPPMPPPFVNPDNEKVKETECGDTPTISYDNFESVKRIDFIDATCAKYAPKVLDFTESGDSTSIISDPPSFHILFEGSDMILEEEIEEYIKT